jgi:ADP-ribose pyrophosphatase
MEQPAERVTERVTERAFERPLERTVLCKGRKFDFERVVYAAPDGGRIEREVVRHPGAVVIVPVLDDGRIVLIRNRRYAVGTTLWELPAGTLEAGEDPAHCAARELTEETGFRARTIDPLGSFYTTPGLTDELMHAFCARGLTEVGQALEPGEEIEVHPVPRADAIRMLDDGDLMDAKSMLALLLAQRRGFLDGGAP